MDRVETTTPCLTEHGTVRLRGSIHPTIGSKPKLEIGKTALLGRGFGRRKIGRVSILTVGFCRSARSPLHSWRFLVKVFLTDSSLR